MKINKLHLKNTNKMKKLIVKMKNEFNEGTPTALIISIAFVVYSFLAIVFFIEKLKLI